MKPPLNKEQLEAMIAEGKIESAIVAFSNYHGIPAYALQEFVDAILFAKFNT